MRLQVGSGIANYIKQLENVESLTDQTIGKAVYAGADIVTDAIKANIQALPTDDTHPEQVTAPRTIQKKGLIDSLGIAPMRNDNGYVNVKAGFDGYNGLKTKKYPKGQPNAMIARTFESGNSFTKKHPFVGPAVRKTKDQAEMKMAQVVDDEINKIMR